MTDGETETERVRRQQREFVHGSGAPSGLAKTLQLGRSGPPGRPRRWSDMSRGEQVAGALVNLFVLAVLVALALLLLPRGAIAVSGSIALVLGWTGLLIIGIRRASTGRSVREDNNDAEML